MTEHRSPGRTPTGLRHTAHPALMEPSVRRRPRNRRAVRASGSHWPRRGIRPSTQFSLWLSGGLCRGGQGRQGTLTLGGPGGRYLWLTSTTRMASLGVKFSPRDAGSAATRANADGADELGMVYSCIALVEVASTGGGLGNAFSAKYRFSRSLSSTSALARRMEDNGG